MIALLGSSNGKFYQPECLKHELDVHGVPGDFPFFPTVIMEFCINKHVYGVPPGVFK